MGAYVGCSPSDLVNYYSRVTAGILLVVGLALCDIVNKQLLQGAEK